MKVSLFRLPSCQACPAEQIGFRARLHICCTAAGSCRTPFATNAQQTHLLYVHGVPSIWRSAILCQTVMLHTII